jgi:multiple antibiotic resistance protein
MDTAIRGFLLGFPALFSIVNPLAGAFVFQTVTAEFGATESDHLARLVAVYSLLVMLVALWAGSYVLAFFGITLAALRVAGGLILALNSWNRLAALDVPRDPAKYQAIPATSIYDIALFPLTIPFTAGPGTIAVAVALGAARPRSYSDLLGFFVGMTTACLAVAVTIWITYRYADRIVRLLGQTGSRMFTRLSAFLLLCIGVQIMITGVQDVLEPLFAKH